MALPGSSLRVLERVLKRPWGNADTHGMLHVPRWLKLVALASLAAEATAAAAVFWHSR